MSKQSYQKYDEDSQLEQEESQKNDEQQESNLDEQPQQSEGLKRDERDRHRDIPLRRATPLTYYPVDMYCPSCERFITTKIRHVSGFLTYTFVVLIILIGGILGCCLIPLCTRYSKDVIHKCPKCNEFIGRLYRCPCC